MVQRVAVLVDVQNMFYSAKNLKNGKIDYDKLLDYIVDGRTCVRSIAYVVRKPEVNQNAFLDALSQFGYDVKIKDVKSRTHGSTSWDVGIAVDAITFADKVDTIVLVTGDGDISACIPVLKAKGVRVEVCAFQGTISSDLVHSADSCYFIPEEALLDYTFKADGTVEYVNAEKESESEDEPKQDTDEDEGVVDSRT